MAIYQGAGLDIHTPSADINRPPMTGGANKFQRRCGIQSTDSSRSKIRNSSCRYTCKTVKPPHIEAKVTGAAPGAPLLSSINGSDTKK